MNNRNKYSCDDGFEKSRKKIEEDNKNVKCRYIQGPTGPQGSPGSQGPQGPIGSTEIVAYAERYLDEKRDLKLETQVDTIVPLTSNGPAFLQIITLKML